MFLKYLNMDQILIPKLDLSFTNQPAHLRHHLLKQIRRKDEKQEQMEEAKAYSYALKYQKQYLKSLSLESESKSSIHDKRRENKARDGKSFERNSSYPNTSQSILIQTSGNHLIGQDSATPIKTKKTRSWLNFFRSTKDSAQS